jgi:hypothetical protein
MVGLTAALGSGHINLKTAVEQTKIPFALSLSKGWRDFGLLTKWVGILKPSMLRQAQRERLQYASTAVFRINDIQMIQQNFERKLKILYCQYNCL